MVEGLIGKKIGMTQIFDENGTVIPVTVITAGPCAVIQKKTRSKDGYAKVQLGFIEDKALKKANKPKTGHFSKSEVDPTRMLKEFRYDESSEIKVGDKFSVDLFKIGERVHISGKSIGKGFAGVMKRWGFHGGKDTHGSMFHRRPGSIGSSAYPSRVLKGRKLPGHMGNSQVTIRNMTIIDTDKENNLLVVRGSIPGSKGGYVFIRKAEFQAKSSG
ncbi:MAG: 50S ribosomal protein L3 [Candidatus Aminicenantes bacterium]|nr:50S ribosomal protein L3 [Candidatus Aminicenantes bacterium]